MLITNEPPPLSWIVTIPNELPWKAPMTTSLIYTVNDPAVIYEEFGDEIVAVNLDTGIYYSLRGSAYEIWLILKTDASTEEVLDALLAKYPKHVDKVTGCIPLKYLC